MRSPPRYTVIVPVFNEDEVVGECHRRLKAVMDTADGPYELVFVDDGSVDATPSILRMLSERDPNVRVITFSRNFGHQIAITAGMHFARGDAIVVIDADLQDPPEVIPHMIAKWRDGFHVVYGKRTSRQGETVFKKLSARLFYRVLRRLTNVAIPVDVGDFRLVDRAVCDAMNTVGERNRFVRGLISWLGFSQTEVPYRRDRRFAGQTKYPLRKMVHFMLDAVTSFSYVPLKIATVLGSLVSAAGFVYLFVVLYQRLFTDRTVPGWTSIVSLTLVFNGMILLILGIIGEYIGRIYDESKNRPLYVVRDILGYAPDERPEQR